MTVADGESLTRIPNAAPPGDPAPPGIAEFAPISPRTPLIWLPKMDPATPFRSQMPRAKEPVEFMITLFEMMGDPWYSASIPANVPLIVFRVIWALDWFIWIPYTDARWITLSLTMAFERTKRKAMPADRTVLNVRLGELSIAATARSPRSKVDQLMEPPELALNWTPYQGIGMDV